MHKLTSLVLAIFCLAAITPPAHAAKTIKAVKAVKERLVLMPLRVPVEDNSLQGSMETALVEGLQQKYEVFSGEQVATKAKAIFLKESRNTAKKECDETRCMQDIAIAFQAEHIATANVTKRADGYFLALSVQNIFDNKVVYSKSTPCKNCDAYQVVDKLKELSGASVQAAAPAAESPEPPATISGNPNNPENSLWGEVQKGNSADDYNAYLAQYPKGKYVVLAKTRIKKLQEQEAVEAARQEQGAWESADSTATEASYAEYLGNYPRGQYATLATARIAKLKKEAAILAAQAPKAGQTFKDCPECPEMVVIPAGSFSMGSNERDDEKPIHPVRIVKAYALGKTEVTKGQFAAFVNATNYDAGNVCWAYTTKWEEVSGKNWRNPGYSQTDNHPVACINWNDAKAYTNWLSRKTGKTYQLPSEAQWEYACRAGGSHTYCGSDDVDNIAWYGRKNGDTTQPVAQKQANDFGLHDMSGSLWEWTEDSYHANYNGAPNDGSVWSGNGAKRVVRGGSWGYGTEDLESSNRYAYSPALRHGLDGFRVSRTLP